MKKSDIYYKANKKAKAKKRAMTSLITWLAFAFFFVFVDMTDGSNRLEWAFFPIFGWGLGVLIQCVRAFDFFGMGEKWEKDEIRKEIEKRKKIMNNYEDEYDDLEELELEDLKEMRNMSKDSDFV